tara:strand:- start:1247 stop:2191 length:945 start_codon:yes stop_codon:yes gene_type:complete
LIENRSFKSIYFGGGTPSLTSSRSIRLILDAVRNKLSDSGAEITFEMNPRDVTPTKVNELLMAGVNRISLGIQSYNENELRNLGRNHNQLDSIQSGKTLEGINSSIDLMYGIEDQTPDSLACSLKNFFKTNFNHLSLYQLTIEPNTIFYKKELRLPKENLIEDMENVAKEMLEKNGFYQYEVSSWSRLGYEGQHNLNYWLFGDFLGVGPGSHSKISNNGQIIRFRKIKPINGYIRNQKKTDLKIISGNELDIDLAMNLLRIKDGVSLKDININLPSSFLDKYQQGISKGLLTKEKIGTTKKGFQFMDETIQLFF